MATGNYHIKFNKKINKTFTTMKTTKLNTGVIVTQNEKGSIISVSSPYWVDKPSILQKIKNLWKW